MFRKILVANDGSPGADAALKAAIDLAVKYCAELHMISVEEIPHLAETIDEVEGEREEPNTVSSRSSSGPGSSRLCGACRSTPTSFRVIRFRPSSSSCGRKISTFWSSDSWAIRRSTTG